MQQVFNNYRVLQMGDENMEGMNLETWQLILAGVLYIAYLCWVMFGGMRKKKVNIRMYVIMTALLIWGLASAYDGIHSMVEIANICISLLIGLIKGVYLGRKKIVEKMDETWYIHHDGKYIIAWVLFFAVRTAITQILKIETGVQIPIWHTVLYFAFYYPWRTINIFIANPEMRYEVLQRKHRQH